MSSEGVHTWVSSCVHRRREWGLLNVTPRSDSWFARAISCVYVTVLEAVTASVVHTGTTSANMVYSAYMLV